MKKQTIKLYQLHVTCQHATLGTLYAGIQVAARHATTAIRLAQESAARRYHIIPSKVDTYELFLLRSTNWTSERVHRYN